MRQAFSLIELMVLIAIVGIFVGIAVPSYKTHLVSTRVATIFNTMKYYSELGQEYYETNGRFGTAEELGLTIDSDPYVIANPQTINKYTSSQIVNVDATSKCYNNIRFTLDGASLGIAQSFDIQMLVRNEAGLFKVTCGIPWDQDSSSYADVLQYFPQSCTDQNVSSCTE